MDTLGLHIPWPCCALLLESSPMVVASGVTLTSSPRPSRLRSVTRLPGVPTGTRPGPHWEPSPLSRVLSWVRRLPLHLLGAWQGSRGHRIHRLLRFSGGLLATVNLLATITPRCPPRPRESALSLDAVLCLWGRPPSSPLHLRFRGAPPSSPQSRAEQSRRRSCHPQAPWPSSVPYHCLSPRRTQVAWGGWPPDPILTGTPKALPPHSVLSVWIQARARRQRSESGQGPSPPAQGLPGQF